MTSDLFLKGALFGSHEVIEYVKDQRNRSGRLLHMYRVRCTVCGHESIKQTQSLNKLKSQCTKCCLHCPPEVRTAHKQKPTGKFTQSYEYKHGVPCDLARLAFNKRW